MQPELESLLMDGYVVSMWAKKIEDDYLFTVRVGEGTESIVIKSDTILSEVIATVYQKVQKQASPPRGM